MPKRLTQDIVAGRPLITAKQDMTVRAACRLMTDSRIGALLVVEGQAIQGIFTERDALNKVLSGGLDPDTTRLSQVMVSDPQTIRGNQPLAYALHLMSEGNFRHVPVVNDAGKPIGMVSARDALGQDMVDLERELRRRSELEASIGY